MVLNERLKMAADMVKHGSLLVDIGTDHAYLPVFLVKNGCCPKAVAADLRKGPLENARETVSSNGLSDKIELRLSDGLNSISAQEAQSIVIAGMGGTLISDILSKAEWIKNPDIRLILQPQTHSEDVRKFLFENGFKILSENACFSQGRAYICLCAEYDGITRNPTASEIYFGIHKELKCKNTASTEYYNRKLKRAKIKVKCMSEGSSVIVQGKAYDEFTFLKKVVEEAE